MIGIHSDLTQRAIYFSPPFAALQSGIDALMPKTKNHIYDVSKDQNHYLLYTSGATESGTYYLGHHNPAKLTALEYRYRHLPPSL